MKKFKISKELRKDPDWRIANEIAIQRCIIYDDLDAPRLGVREEEVIDYDTLAALDKKILAFFRGGCER